LYPGELLTDFFKEHERDYVFVGKLRHYKGVLWDHLIDENGNIADNYSSVIFVLRIADKAGFCIQFNEKQVFDSFEIEYRFNRGLRINKYSRLHDIDNIILAAHRDTLLSEISNVHFEIMTYDELKYSLPDYVVEWFIEDGLTRAGAE
jgi:hypothetical protein